MNKSTKRADSSVTFLDRIKGVPIETNLAPYMTIAEAAKKIGEQKSLSPETSCRTLRSFYETPKGEEGERMPICLAAASAACREKLGMDPYIEQLAAAVALCSGRLAQLQTGEGKTLAAALAGCHCALRDGNLHILTANDYLAYRDAEWMRPIYESLGLSVAWVTETTSLENRKKAYAADVVYLTARELGFDYLRDGLEYSQDTVVQRGYSSVIVDEADFILIDESRVPLVIAGSDGSELPDDVEDAITADTLARRMVSGKDYTIDPEERRVSLSFAGQAKVETAFGRGGIHESVAASCFARTYAALHARCLLVRDVDYLVKDDSVKLVDDFTGRVAEKRQWPWGVQAALEIKEGLAPRPEGRIYGSITTQHLMGLFPRIAGMTATAIPAAEEFFQTYGMRTVVIPPRKPSRRSDESDRVFWNRKAKLAAVEKEVSREHRRGRPILIGTASVRESEELAETLRKAGLPCVVLNARNDEAEAALIAAAGQPGAITISTNMAGRGTDIRLGEGAETPEIGGLYVIGTNKYESRRVDDQLRGRAGRQGDPGGTRFFISLEDELFKRYGIRDFLPTEYRSGNLKETAAIENAAVLREINRAQALIEGQNSKIRRALRKYSLLLEYDRRYLRQLRDTALRSGVLPPEIETALPDTPRLDQTVRRNLTRVFLSRLDAAWADHLALAEDNKEGLSLRRYGGKDPGIEYVRDMAEAFERTLEGLFEATIADCRAILSGRAATETPSGIPIRPSSTWTYVVEEDALPGFKLSAVSGASALLLGPLALPIFLIEQGARLLSNGKRRGEKPRRRQQ